MLRTPSWVSMDKGTSVLEIQQRVPGDRRDRSMFDCDLQKDAGKVAEGLLAPVVMWVGGRKSFELGLFNCRGGNMVAVKGGASLANTLNLHILWKQMETNTVFAWLCASFPVCLHSNGLFCGF